MTATSTLQGACACAYLIPRVARGSCPAPCTVYEQPTAVYNSKAFQVLTQPCAIPQLTDTGVQGLEEHCCHKLRRSRRNGCTRGKRWQEKTAFFSDLRPPRRPGALIPMAP